MKIRFYFRNFIWKLLWKSWKFIFLFYWVKFMKNDLFQNFIWRVIMADSFPRPKAISISFECELFGCCELWILLFSIQNLWNISLILVNFSSNKSFWELWRLWLQLKALLFFSILSFSSCTWEFIVIKLFLIENLFVKLSFSYLFCL